MGAFVFMPLWMLSVVMVTILILMNDVGNVRVVYTG